MNDFQSDTLPHCPLCQGIICEFYYNDNKRTYLECSECRLVFVHPDYYVALDEERARYCNHENTLDDNGYVDMLSRVVKPVTQRVKPGCIGLDFGSGPEPVLASLLKDSELAVKAFDIFFADNHNVFDISYDFITMTEVIEHLQEPEKEMKMLWKVLKNNGFIVIMTQVLEDDLLFSEWFYKNDVTHICFYRLETLQWLAEYLAASLDRIEKDIFLLTKTV